MYPQKDMYKEHAVQYIEKLYRKTLDPREMCPAKMKTEAELPSGRSMYSTYLHMAIPSVLESVLISMIGIADTVMVSGVGTDAVAAVGLVTQPRFLMLCFFWALSTGITAVVSRRKGEGRQQDANRSLRSTLVITLLLSLLLMAIFMPLSVPLMKFAGAVEGETLDDANTYFRIITLALPFNALSMIICAAQRGEGNTRLTMAVNITSNLVNILFNYLLIKGIGPFPELKVTGAAIATAIGLFVGFVLSVISLFNGKRKKRFLQVSLRDRQWLEKSSAMDVINVAKGAMVEQVAMRIGFFAYAKIVAELGTDAFAAHQIDMQFLNLSFSFADGLGIAGTALVGQMLGARRKDLAYIYGSLAQRLSFAISILIAALCVFGRAFLVDLFINEENAGPLVRTMAENVMLIVAVFQPFQMLAVVASGALRGAGDVKYTARVMLLTVTVIRPVVSILAVVLLKKYAGTEAALCGAWLASLCDMTVRMVLMLRRYRNGKWQEIKV